MPVGKIISGGIYLKMSSVTASCAAILCAAIIAPSAAFAVPAAAEGAANSFDFDTVAPDYDFPDEGYFVPVGKKVTLTVGGVTNNNTVAWYSSTERKNSGYNWKKLPATGADLSFTMTEAMNGIHIKAVVTDKTTGKKTEQTMETTLSCVTVNAALGTPVVSHEDEYYRIRVPVIIKGAPGNAIDFFQADLRFDCSLFADPAFELSGSIGGFDVAMSDFRQKDNRYTWGGGNSSATAHMGSDNCLGYFEIYAPDTADIRNAKFALENVQLGTACINGYMYYGVKSVGGTSIAASLYPVAKVQSKGRAFRLSWTTVPNAQAYVVAYSANGKNWKAAKKVSAGTTSFTYTGAPKGTYYLSVGAYVNGKVDTSSLARRAVKLVIK